MPNCTSPSSAGALVGQISKPRVSVIIPHYNDLDNLLICLQLLSNQTLPADQFEVIVADNNSTVGIAAVRERVGALAGVILATEQGAAAARNAGVAVARAEILAFIDADCRPAPDWLEQGLKGLKTEAAIASAAPPPHPLSDIVGGRMQVTAQQSDRFLPVEAFEAVFAFNNEAYIKKKKFSVTANLFVRRAVFEAVGGFRQRVSEDMDWCLRAVELGYSIDYAGEALVQHPARQTWAELTRKWQRLLRENYQLVCEQRLGRLFWLAKSWGVLLSPLVHTLTVLRSPQLQSWQERWGAIAILFRIRFYRFWQSYHIFFTERRGVA